MAVVELHWEKDYSEQKIVDANTYRPPGFRKFIGRFIGMTISILPFGLGFLWIIWDDKNQGWHDKFVESVESIVVNYEYEDIFSPRSDWLKK